MQTSGSIGTKMDVISRADVSAYTSIIPDRPLANLVTVDYNSWIESPKGRKLSAKLDKDVVLAEGTRLHMTSCAPCALTPLIYRLQAVRYRTHLHGAHGRLAGEQGR